MKRLIFIALLLASCGKENRFHKQLQGTWKIYEVTTNGGTPQQIADTASGFDMVFTEDIVTGWSYQNGKTYDLLDKGLIKVYDVNGQDHEVSIDIDDDMTLIDGYNNKLLLEFKYK